MPPRRSKRLLSGAIAEARPGKGVKVVRRELRDTEAEARQEQDLNDLGKEQAAHINEEALRLFDSVREKFNLTCPKCETAFHSYVGCNALTCANSSCEAKFCAICWQDCGNDAHGHVRENHGDVFDREMFERSSRERSRRIMEGVLAKLEEEGRPFDVRQLVHNHLERAGHVATSSLDSSSKAGHFIEDATADLMKVIASDRRNVLVESHSGSITRQRISASAIAPRGAVPENIRIWLYQEADEFELVVQAEIAGRFVQAQSLIQVKEWIKDGVIPSFGSLPTLESSIRCAVVAFDGADTLYQTLCDSKRKALQD
jgi:hypothetical protein